MEAIEKKCKWYFADQPNVQEIGPNNAMEQNFKQHPYASLVRESIQNSLDAVLDKTQPVRMKFSFNEMKCLEYPSFFELKEHIKGCIDYYSNNHNAKVIYEPMLRLFEDNIYHDYIGYIRVSDYNTKGMDYDDNKTDSPFYAFVRSAGVSAKDDNNAGGSFGFGKAAYYLLSPISTIIVSTCTEKFDKYFEGAASLCTHTYKGVKKVAFGYYDDQNGKPICDEADIPAMFRRAEPGTDINILGFDMQYQEEAEKEMTESVLRNFWMAILNGRLEVEIGDTIKITQDNIASLMDLYFPDEEDSTGKARYSNPHPYFNALYLQKKSKNCTFREAELPLLGHVILYVNKQKGATDKISYMRSSQMLIQGKRNKTPYGMYGVFYCDSEKGNDILRNMENPAHDEWKAGNWRVNGRTYGMGRIALQEMEEFINDSLNDIFSMKTKEVINIKGLEDFLYIPTSFNDENDNIDTDNGADITSGDPTLEVQDEGTSYTTDLPDEDDNPTITSNPNPPSTGHVLINNPTTATNNTGGNLRSGHGKAEKKPKTMGIQKPGDAKDTRTEDVNGEHGLFATPISVPYRTFSQIEDSKVYHYVVLHPDQEVGNVRLHFFAVGEESDEELQIAESNIGNISGNIIRDIHLEERRLQLRVRFTDNMKHAIKLSAEELYEV